MNEPVALGGFSKGTRRNEHVSSSGWVVSLSRLAIDREGIFEFGCWLNQWKGIPERRPPVGGFFWGVIPFLLRISRTSQIFKGGP